MVATAVGAATATEAVATAGAAMVVAVGGGRGRHWRGRRRGRQWRAAVGDARPAKMRAVAIISQSDALRGNQAAHLSRRTCMLSHAKAHNGVKTNDSASTPSLTIEHMV